jgi:hypothetical protein
MKLKTAPIFVATLALGCVHHGSEESSTDRFRFDVSERPRVEVELDRGSIEILGIDDSTEVSVIVNKIARAVNEEVATSSLERLSVRVEQDGKTIRVRVKREGGWRETYGTLRSDVEIGVPRDSDLKLTTHDGRIELRNVRGEIEAESGDGRIHLNSVEGSVRARTADGSIVGEKLSGDFDGHTEDGRIELMGSFGGLRAVSSDGSITVDCVEAVPLTRNWMLRSSDGSITFGVPAGFSAELEASTSDGRIESNLALIDAKVTSNRVRGTLGEGGKLVLIKTSDGRVRLRSR